MTVTVSRSMENGTSPDILGPGGRLLLIGAGKMGSAMLEGWLALGLRPQDVAVLDPAPSSGMADMLAEKGIALNPPPNADNPPSVLVLAIKPQVLESALPRIVRHVGHDTLVVSIMAGKTLATLAEGLPPETAIVRAMPNTPASVGRGITVAAPNSHVRAEQRGVAHRLLAASGKVEWITDEGLLDAVTAVSGSGPAYVFLLVEAMARAGVAAGLPADLSMKLARETVAGSGELLHRSPLPADVLRENVTSPGGTTAAALGVLMAPDGLDLLLKEAVAAAVERSRQLAG